MWLDSFPSSDIHASSPPATELAIDSNIQALTPWELDDGLSLDEEYVLTAEDILRDVLWDEIIDVLWSKKISFDLSLLPSWHFLHVLLSTDKLREKSSLIWRTNADWKITQYTLTLKERTAIWWNSQFLKENFPSEDGKTKYMLKWVSFSESVVIATAYQENLYDRYTLEIDTETWIVKIIPETISLGGLDVISGTEVVMKNTMWTKIASTVESTLSPAWWDTRTLTLKQWSSTEVIDLAGIVWQGSYVHPVPLSIEPISSGIYWQVILRKGTDWILQIEINEFKEWVVALNPDIKREAPLKKQSNRTFVLDQVNQILIVNTWNWEIFDIDIKKQRITGWPSLVLLFWVDNFSYKAKKVWTWDLEKVEWYRIAFKNNNWILDVSASLNLWNTTLDFNSINANSGDRSYVSDFSEFIETWNITIISASKEEYKGHVSDTQLRYKFQNNQEAKINAIELKSKSWNKTVYLDLESTRRDHPEAWYWMSFSSTLTVDPSAELLANQTDPEVMPYDGIIRFDGREIIVNQCNTDLIVTSDFMSGLTAEQAAWMKKSYLTSKDKRILNDTRDDPQKLTIWMEDDKGVEWNDRDWLMINLDAISGSVAGHTMTPRRDLFITKKVQTSRGEKNQRTLVFDYTGEGQEGGKWEWVLYLQEHLDAVWDPNGYTLSFQPTKIPDDFGEDMQINAESIGGVVDSIGDAVSDVYDRASEKVQIITGTVRRIRESEAPTLQRDPENIKVIKYDQEVIAAWWSTKQDMEWYKFLRDSKKDEFYLNYDHSWLPDFTKDIQYIRIPWSEIEDGKRYYIEWHGGEWYIQLYWNPNAQVLQCLLSPPEDVEEPKWREIYNTNAQRPVPWEKFKDQLGQRWLEPENRRDWEPHMWMDISVDKKTNVKAYAANGWEISHVWPVWFEVSFTAANGHKYIHRYMHMKDRKYTLADVWKTINAWDEIGAISDVWSPWAIHLHMEVLIYDPEWKFSDFAASRERLEWYRYLSPFEFFDDEQLWWKIKKKRKPKPLDPEVIPANKLPKMPADASEYLWPEEFLENQEKLSWNVMKVLRYWVYPPGYTYEMFHKDLEAHLWESFNQFDTPQPLESDPEKVQEFIDESLPLVLALAKKYKVLPSICYSFVLLESAYFRNEADYRVNHNQNFGMKQWSWKGPFHLKETIEYKNWKPVTVMEPFRSFIWIEHSFLDFYMRSIRVWWQEFSLSDNWEDQFETLVNSSYATDPNYEKKIPKIMKKFNLPQYDESVAEDQLPVVEKSKEALEQVAWVYPLDESFEIEIYKSWTFTDTDIGISSFENTLWSDYTVTYTKPKDKVNKSYTREWGRFSKVRFGQDDDDFMLYTSKYKEWIDITNVIERLLWTNPEYTIDYTKDSYFIDSYSGKPVTQTIDGQEYAFAVLYTKSGKWWKMKVLAMKFDGEVPSEPKLSKEDKKRQEILKQKWAITVSSDLKSRKVFDGIYPKSAPRSLVLYYATPVSTSSSKSPFTQKEANKRKLWIADDWYFHLVFDQQTSIRIDPNDFNLTGSGQWSKTYTHDGKQFWLRMNLSNDWEFTLYFKWK